MANMSESASLKKLTDQLGNEQYPNGVCPFMSTVQFIPVRNSLDVTQPVPVPVPGLAPCLGAKCQLWHERKNCSLRPDTDLINILDAVRASLVLVGDYLEKIDDIYEQTHPI